MDRDSMAKIRLKRAPKQYKSGHAGPTGAARLQRRVSGLLLEAARFERKAGEAGDVVASAFATSLRETLQAFNKRAAQAGVAALAGHSGHPYRVVTVRRQVYETPARSEREAIDRMLDGTAAEVDGATEEIWANRLCGECGSTLTLRTTRRVTQGTRGYDVEEASYCDSCDREVADDDQP